jgi:hypothetical protein
MKRAATLFASLALLSAVAPAPASAAVPSDPHRIFCFLVPLCEQS